jgi:hypothetical protein
MIGELTYIIIVIILGLMVIGLTIVLIYSIKLLKQKNQNNSNSAPAITYMGDEILSICNFDGVTKSIKISDIKHITIETDGGLIRQAYDNIGFVVQGTCGEEKVVVKYVAYPSQAIAKLDKLIGN